MARTIRRVEFHVPAQPKVTKVAAYARVSSGKDAMLHSLSAQVSYYSELIQGHAGWLYCGVFTDEALTGTKENRDGFQRLLTECRAGNIDLIITKSISRFARNTVTLLQTVRELKLLGVDVFFEEQNIHTISADGELMMTILASYAQEESLSASENQKWRIRKNFRAGMPWNGTILGYRINDGQYEIVPGEAALVCRIFSEYLSGSGYEMIARKLNEEGFTSRLNRQWGRSAVSKILSNYAYTGNLVLQKTYRENHITKRTYINHGELPKYHAQKTHEAIIEMELFLAVQEEKARRAKQFTKKPAPKTTYPFTGKVLCMGCGKNYRRKTTAARPVWICSTFNSKGKAYCPTAKQIPEEALLTVTAKVLGLKAFDASVFGTRIKQIQVGVNNTLRYVFMDGHSVDTTWQDRSRSKSWTPEMKEAASQKEMQRNRNENEGFCLLPGRHASTVGADNAGGEAAPFCRNTN